MEVRRLRGRRVRRLTAVYVVLRKKGALACKSSANLDDIAEHDRSARLARALVQDRFLGCEARIVSA